MRRVSRDQRNNASLQVGHSPGSRAVKQQHVAFLPDSEAVTLFCCCCCCWQAAGVYDYLAEVMLPPLFASLKGDRPAEIMARLSNVMCQLCLAEAQALTAFRAGQRSSSSGSLVASLHAGAAELYEKAAKVVRDYIGGCIGVYRGVVNSKMLHTSGFETEAVHCAPICDRQVFAA
jgi:hypothetical protein